MLMHGVEPVSAADMFLACQVWLLSSKAQRRAVSRKSGNRDRPRPALRSSRYRGE